jgi:hypothetical protein
MKRCGGYLFQLPIPENMLIFFIHSSSLSHSRIDMINTISWCEMMKKENLTTTTLMATATKLCVMFLSSSNCFLVCLLSKVDTHTWEEKTMPILATILVVIVCHTYNCCTVIVIITTSKDDCQSFFNYSNDPLQNINFPLIGSSLYRH